jgi:hypothetical protein
LDVLLGSDVGGLGVSGGVVVELGAVVAPVDVPVAGVVDVLVLGVLVVEAVVVVLGSFGWVNGSRTGPLRSETLGTVWTLTAGTAVS